MDDLNFTKIYRIVIHSLKQGSTRGLERNFCGPIVDWNSVILRYFGCISSVFVKIWPEKWIFFEIFPNAAHRLIWVGHPRFKAYLKKLFSYTLINIWMCIPVYHQQQSKDVKWIMLLSHFFVVEKLQMIQSKM
jgi:hypothetical protein